MDHDVFVSYSTKNATVADTVCAGLERRGIRCWIAPRDITEGQTWAGAIVRAIDTCKVFVIIVSAASNCSDDVLQEIQNAASAGAPIIPFRIEDITLSDDMRYYLGTRQWLDALTKPLEQHIARLAETLGRLLGRDVASGASQAPAAPTGEGQPTGAEPAPAPHVPTQAPPHGEPERTAVVLTPPATHHGPWQEPGTRLGQEITGPDGGVYVWVPPGSFVMGSDHGAESESPVHRVDLDGFWLGKHEATNAQYRAFCDEAGRPFPSESHQGTDHPVVCLSWTDADAYCTHYGLSLPTEAQWEYAAAGPDAHVYPWGDDWDPRRVCCCENIGPDRRTFPVGSFPEGASWCGALDMAGNVWEWCADWYDPLYYAESPAQNPPGPSDGEWRVVRGGSWGCGTENRFRCAGRSRDTPVNRNAFNGFRCARTVQ